VQLIYEFLLHQRNDDISAAKGKRADDQRGGEQFHQFVFVFFEMLHFSIIYAFSGIVEWHIKNSVKISK